MGSDRESGERGEIRGRGKRRRVLICISGGDETVFYFDVLQEHLRGVLDIWSQFFIAPLFNKEKTELEIQAVDSGIPSLPFLSLSLLPPFALRSLTPLSFPPLSLHAENGKNLQSDPWRSSQLLRSRVRPGHPFGHFGTGKLIIFLCLLFFFICLCILLVIWFLFICLFVFKIYISGNHKTLSAAPNLREQLLEYHSKYYSPNIMKLVILGRGMNYKENKDRLKSSIFIISLAYSFV